MQPLRPGMPFLQETGMELRASRRETGPRRNHPVAARRLWTAVVLLLSVAALAAAWRWTPLREMLDLRSLVSDIRILSREIGLSICRTHAGRSLKRLSD